MNAKTYIKRFLEWCNGRFGINGENGRPYESAYGEDRSITDVLFEYTEDNPDADTTETLVICNFIKWCTEKYGIDGENGELYDADTEKTAEFDTVFDEFVNEINAVACINGKA